MGNGKENHGQYPLNALVRHWRRVSEGLPEPFTAVVVANIGRHMAFEPFGCWKGVGVLNNTNYRPYWDVIGETRAMMLEGITHWMPLDEPPCV